MKKLLLLFILFSSNIFADSHIDFSLSEFCYLQPGVQDRGGVYYFPNQTKGITATSLCVFKNAYGQYFSKGKLVNGKKEGNWIKWSRNGVKAFDSFYKNGKKEGICKSYFWKTNIPCLEVTYKDGKKNGAERRYDNEGNLAEEKYYLNDTETKKPKLGVVSFKGVEYKI